MDAGCVCKLIAYVKHGKMGLTDLRGSCCVTVVLL